MQNRRKFIQQSLIGAAYIVAGGLPLYTYSANDYIKITVLHTNDWHSRIEPFGMDGSKWQGMGGAARRATLINQIRSEEDNVLLLDAGDIFQGTPYFNYFHGELEYKLMNYMQYDAVTLGNHDFDAGLDGLKKQLEIAKFKTVVANYDFGWTTLDKAIQPYNLFKKQGIKIGVFGLGIELKGLVPESLYGKTFYQEPITKANETAAYLKENEKCDLIICLSHLGYNYENDKVSDLILAAQSKNIDLIIGGHTHTFLETPTTIVNAEGHGVLINQVGWAGINLGRVDFFLSPNKRYKHSKSNTVKIIK
jgi:5'-nucleotidase